MRIKLSADVIEGHVLEVTSQRDDLAHVLVHPGVLGCIVIVQLIDDELRVTVDLDFFGTHMLSKLQAGDQGLVFGFVVRSWKANT